ncbi:acyl dehydratase [Hoeflea marina]|uniref:Acyl dehydratase n=1 Tax=Hoeflea marina TaxID=274592 RepID=A0A317PDN3_9HYPH|nr:MaoC family dehydratase [Hoeflea marina]PWV97588.1 acyl dehydratase [Hoeflea marina]
MAAPQDIIHYEDMEPGVTFPLGPMPVDRDEVVAFAREFDPQPMHLDETAATASILGGLAASGWHSCAMMMRMMCDSYVLDTASEGAPQIDFVKWRRPVLVGDVLSGISRVVQRRRSKSKPAIGIVALRHEITNQRGEVVMEVEHPVMVRLRNPEAEL